MRLTGIGLDGTLLNSDQSTSQKNARTMKHLPEDCSPLICSGREVEGINNILEKSGLRVLAVGLNGSVGFDGKKKIPGSFFDKNDIKKTDSVLSKFPAKIYTNLGGYKSRNYKNKVKEIFHKVGNELSIKGLSYKFECKKSICSAPYNNIEEIIERDAISIYKFSIFISNCRLKANIFNHLKKMLNVSVIKSTPVSIEIVPQNVSRGVTFDRLESIYSLKELLRIAIGDSSDDLPMFKSTDTNFATGNDHQEIMKKADYVTVSNGRDGAPQAFERVLTI